MNPSEPLARPMSIGDLLDRAITLYRRNFLILVSIAAIVSIPLLIVQALAAVFTLPLDLTSLSRRSSASTFDSSFLIYLGVVGIASIVFAIASVFEHGAVVAVISESFQGGGVGVRQAYGRAFRRAGALLGALILSGLLYILIFGVLFIPFFALLLSASTIGASSSTANAAIGFITLCVCAGFLPALILWAFFYIRWIFWLQAVVLENKGVRSGLGRSWRLVRGSFWRVFFVVILTGIFNYIITVTPTTAISFAAVLFPSVLVSTVLNSTVAILINILVAPLTYTILTLLYYDLRIRKEGFDLALRAQQLAQEAGA